MALKTDENTFVELRAPEGFANSLQQTAELSLFFTTNERDGLLMYVGPQVLPNMVVSHNYWKSVHFL